MSTPARRSRPRLSSRRDAVLREMGLGPIWRLRSARDAEAALDDGAHEDFVHGDAVHDEAAPSSPPATPPVPAAASPAPAPRSAAPAPASRPAPSHIPAPAPGPREQRRAPAPESRSPAATPPAARAAAAVRASARTLPASSDPERAARIATLDWEALEAEIAACRACVLCERRNQVVPGAGERQAEWMFVGEGPGSEEDKRGEPFVGPAGGLLDNMLAALGLKRSENVYIANAVKCRAPHNRTPEAAEIGACLPYLERQIALVKPRLLVALGRPAALALLNTDVNIAAARGQRLHYQGIPVVVTYHPAYLLRNPQDKGKAWADLCFARRLMAEQT